MTSPAQGSSGSQLYDQLFFNYNNTNSTTVSVSEGGKGGGEGVSSLSPTQKQMVVLPRKKAEDQVQVELAAAANEVIGVLTAIEFLLPLAPWHRRLISSAVVSSSTSSTSTTSSSVRPRITALTARTAASFLLHDCHLSHRQAAETLAKHPWILGIHDIRTRCSGILESLSLLDMSQEDVACVIATHPPSLLLSADRDVLPLLEYLSALGFRDHESAELVSSAPRVLLRGGALEQVTGAVAFWVGRRMGREQLKSLLSGVPEISTMGLRLMQLKADWLAEQGGLGVDDIAAVPDLVRLPLAAVVAPRIAFAKHQQQRMHGSSSDGSTTKQRSLSPEVLQSLMSYDEDVFLSAASSNGNSNINEIASDAQYRAFQAAWSERDFRTWLHSRASTGTSITQYESMEWLAEVEMKTLRDMHDHHVALRELSWEIQIDREREWENVWKDWKKTQVRREQMNLWTRRAKKKREEAAAARAAEELALLWEGTKSKRQPGMCSKSPFCDRMDTHSGPCNKKLAVDMDFGDLMMMRRMNGDGSSVLASVPVLAEEVDNDVEDNEMKEEGRVSSIHLHSIGTVDGGGHEDYVMEALFSRTTTFGRGKTVNELAGEAEKRLDTIGRSGGGDEEEDSTSTSTAITSTSTMIASRLAKEEIEGQAIDDVVHCAGHMERLLRTSPAGILTQRTIDSDLHKAGYSAACVAASKGVLTATGVARVIVEPHWQYHNVPPIAWQLMYDISHSPSVNQDKDIDTSSDSSDTDRKYAHGTDDDDDIHDRTPGGLSTTGLVDGSVPRLTRSAANALILSSLILKALEAAPDGVIARSSLKAWAERRWQGSGKHVRSVVMGLMEQGLVVHRKQRGVASGPMELVLVDLSRYLDAIQGNNSRRSSETSIINTSTLHAVGQDPRPALRTTAVTPTTLVAKNSSSTTTTTTTATTTLVDSALQHHRAYKDLFDAHRNKMTFWSPPSVADNNNVYYRSMLRSAARIMGSDWSRLETGLPVDTVRECAASLLSFIRQQQWHASGVAGKTLNSWALKQGYTKDVVTAAKAIVYSSSLVDIVGVDEVEEGRSGGIGLATAVPTRVWVVVGDDDNDNIGSNSYARKLLDRIRTSSGGYMTKGDVRMWGKELALLQLQLQQEEGMPEHGGSTGTAHMHSMAMDTLIESGCVAVVAVPHTPVNSSSGTPPPSGSTGRRNFRLVALDLRAYAPSSSD